MLSLDRAFASEMTDYVVSFSNDAPNLAFRLRAYESDSQISVFRDGDSRDYFAGARATADVSDEISLIDIGQTTVSITVNEVFPDY